MGENSRLETLPIPLFGQGEIEMLQAAFQVRPSHLFFHLLFYFISLSLPPLCTRPSLTYLCIYTQLTPSLIAADGPPGENLINKMQSQARGTPMPRASLTWSGRHMTVGRDKGAFDNLPWAWAEEVVVEEGESVQGRGRNDW